MGGGSQAKDHPLEYIGASAMSAMINYPLWRASAIGQSGFRVSASTFQGRSIAGLFVTSVPNFMIPYLHAFAPPYKGMVATIAGMTWVSLCELVYAGLYNIQYIYICIILKNSLNEDCFVSIHCGRSFIFCYMVSFMIFY